MNNKLQNIRETKFIYSKLCGLFFLQSSLRLSVFARLYFKRQLKKWFLILLVLFSGCNTEKISNCFQKAGEITTKEIPVDAFHELMVYGRTDVFIEQGETYKVGVKTGENLMSGVSAEVKNERLIIRNLTKCNFFRDYNNTKVYVTVPNLTWIQNAGPNTIKSVGTLYFPKIWIHAFDQEEDPEIYTNGDYILNLVSDEIRITSDNFNNFYLSGKTDYFDVYFAAGNGRLEAADLVAQTVNIQHRGTNTLIVNPQQVLKGEIRSTGDVISVNRPPKVDIETFYTGDLIFKAP